MNNPDLFIRLLISWFFPPVGVLLTLSKQNSTQKGQFWINFFLTIIFWIPGFIHAVYFIVNAEINPPQLPGSNNVPTNSLSTINLNNTNTKVAILNGIIAALVGFTTLITFFTNYHKPTEIPFSGLQKTNYPCYLKDNDNRYKLNYKVPYKSKHPKLRITPETVDDNNIIIKELQDENKLIYLTSNPEKTWQYVCVEGMEKYGWVSSDYVIK
ncbi:YqaE/Pmp3 family membrane protein [Nostoc sp.]|uniref:YqaE/Pmp3 family membrane protein n=1 Tax=Nostoc sp. TaxID=1180 RepID=UPI002FF8BADD